MPNWLRPTLLIVLLVAVSVGLWLASGRSMEHVPGRIATLVIAIVVLISRISTTSRGTHQLRRLPGARRVFAVNVDQGTRAELTSRMLLHPNLGDTNRFFLVTYEERFELWSFISKPVILGAANWAALRGATLEVVSGARVVLEWDDPARPALYIEPFLPTKFGRTVREVAPEIADEFERGLESVRPARPYSAAADLHRE